MDETLEKVASALENVENTENILNHARIHIRRNLRQFPPKELECMAQDDVIEYEEIPESRRTKFVTDITAIRAR